MHNKRRTRQEMVTNLQGKKVQTQQVDEVRYNFILTKHSYNNNLKIIML